ncbi:hypothetical protein J2X81_003264 [Sinomonas atrocyanea]|nr:hypothetical protein [Sinomonas atrocyanea]
MALESTSMAAGARLESVGPITASAPAWARRRESAAVSVPG